MAVIFSIIVSTCLQNNLHTFKINSTDIIFHSSSIADLSEPTFRWEVTYFLLYKNSPYSIIKGI